MVKHYKQLVAKYFQDNSFIDSNIKSFDHFVTKEMQKIVNEVGEIIPTIIPQEVQDFKIKFNKVYIEKPQLIEADGSKRNVFPIEARLRQLTYAAPIYLEVSVFINGVQRETFTTQIGKLPIMLKSKYCHLHGLKREELLENGEDPDDEGGYFIVNGNERVLIMVEDLAPNKLFIGKGKSGPARFTGRIFSEGGSYRIPHLIEQMKDGILYLSFTKYQKIPIIAIIKALGLVNDKEIMDYVSKDKQYDDIYINLYECIDLKTQNDALEFISRRVAGMQTKEQRMEKAKLDLDKYLLPNVGTGKEQRMEKAINLCKIMKRFLMVSVDGLRAEDKDHYSNKRLKLSGDLLGELFRVNLRLLVNDILYNFQRLVKRGKFHSMKIIIRDKLLTGRIKTAMATGTWVGGREGVSQNIDRTNFLATSSHLQRVISLLSTAQENFDARALHGTHWQKLCPIETPEGTPIGLRKNLALLCKIAEEEVSEEKLKKLLEGAGLNPVKIK